MQDPALQPILCLLGHPAAGNPMQLGMERAFAAASLDWRYLTLDVAPEQLVAALRGVQSLGFRGAHLCRPHPSQARMGVDRAVGSAELSDWIDCVTLQSDELVGYNCWGTTLRAAVGDPSPGSSANALLVGSERGLLAMAAELALAGWESVWMDGVESTGMELVNARLGRETLKPMSVRKRWPEALGLLVRGTDSYGEAPQWDLTKLERLNGDACVVDLARPTAFSALTRAAEDRGLRAVSGLDALVRYAAETFQLWTGVEASGHVLRETFEEYYEI